MSVTETRVDSVTPLFVGAFALSASFMMVFPLLPALQQRADISTAELGSIATAGFAAALVAQLLIAPFADRGHERQIIPAIIARWSRTDTPLARTAPWAAIGLLRHRSVLGAAMLTAAFMIPIGAYDALFPRFLADLGAPDRMLGAALTVFAVPAIAFATWAGTQVDRHGPSKAALCSRLVQVPVIVSYAVVRLPWAIVAVGLAESGGQMFIGAAAAAAMGVAVPGRRAVTAQGLGEALGTASAALIAVVAAPLYAAGGAAVLFVTTALMTTATLVAGAALVRRGRPIEPPFHADDVGSRRGAHLPRA
jgi:MFS family permease